MQRLRRPSPQTERLVAALAAEPQVWRYGYELVTELGLKSGSLYPILMRLTDRGLLESTWDTEGPRAQRPRHLYRLTEAGLRFAGELVPARTQRALRPQAAGGLA